VLWPVMALATSGMVGCAAMHAVSTFVPAPRRVHAGLQPKGASFHGSRLRAASLPEETLAAHALPRPDIPNSTEAMTRQAADAAMRAYRDGITRQSVRLRLDTAYGQEDANLYGITGTLRGTLPLAESFTQYLWGGEMLRRVRTQGVDQEAATLCYRQADFNLYDAAVFFLTGRSLVTTDKLRGYFRLMGDRLVVLLNSEDAAEPFKVQYKAKDWLGEDQSAAAEVVEVFKETTYYYIQRNVNNWKVVQFRAYPHPWEVWIEDLDYRLVKIVEFADPPSYDDVFQATKDYEEVNNVDIVKKYGKMMRDQGSEPPVIGRPQLSLGR